MPKYPQPLDRRLLRNRRITAGGCWEWTRTRNRKGYGKTAYYPDVRVKRDVTVHRLAAHVWLGLPLDSTMQVNHKCDNPACFNPAHLYIGTQKQNMADCKERGRRGNVKGERNAMAKLQAEDVAEIRHVMLNRPPRGTQARLARKYGVSDAAVRHIVAGQAWRHVSC